MSINDKENSIYSTTMRILKHHKISSADYAEAKTFFDNVLRNDSQKIVVQKAEPQKSLLKEYFGKKNKDPEELFHYPLLCLSSSRIRLA